VPKTISIMLGLVFGLIVFLFSVYYLLSANRIRLVADEKIKIYQNTGSDFIVGEISIGEKVSVIACDDDKSMIYPIVKLGNGRIGYVIFGDFHLERDDFLNFDSSIPVNFSCPA
jgi:hypothetical protein